MKKTILSLILIFTVVLCKSQVSPDPIFASFYKGNIHIIGRIPDGIKVNGEDSINTLVFTIKFVGYLTDSNKVHVAEINLNMPFVNVTIKSSIADPVIGGITGNYKTCLYNNQVRDLFLQYMQEQKLIDLVDIIGRKL